MFKKYFHIIIPVVILLVFFGYKFLQTVGIEQITTEQLAEMMDNQTEDTIYIDVREVHEYNEGHVEGMVNLPLSQLESNYHVLPNDKKIVIFCRSGNRSLQAANILKELGYKDLVNVKGGILAWEGEIVR